MKEDTVKMTLLFDFYGDLLTEKQRNCFDLYYNDDLSLFEIGEQLGITRQGVRGNIVHARELLVKYEEKTGIVRRFSEMQKQIADLEADLRKLFDEIGYSGSELTGILNQLENLKG